MLKSKPLNKKTCDNILIYKNEEKLFNSQDVKIRKIEENKIEKILSLLVTHTKKRQ
jgi:hypothetical protein